jgi:hypothetical protein
MPVKRRVNKRRELLCEDAEKWLRGEPCGFFEFKDTDELAALWAEYGDPKVAVWDKQQGCRGRGLADQPWNPVSRIALELLERQRLRELQND